MKSIEEVQNYFESDIKPRLRDLEEWRITKRKKTVIIDYSFAIPGISFALYLLIRMLIFDFSSEADLTGIIVSALFYIFGGGFLTIFYLHIWDKVKYDPEYQVKNLEYKEIVTGGLLRFMDPNMSYNPNMEVVDGETFLGSEIFAHNIYYPEGYWAEDFVEGKIGETNIRFFEISGFNVYPDSKNASMDKYERIMFSGFFLVADFNKQFQGLTLVLPESGNKNSEWIMNSGRQLIKMDDPEFERLFRVYGTDPIIARYVLSNSLMSRISDLKKKLDKEIYLSFRNNKLYIAIPHSDQFEMNVSRTFYDPARIREFYYDLRISWDIVEDLNMNTRIWGHAENQKMDFYVPEIHLKARSKKVYSILSLTLGFMGLQFFYIGYYLKGFLYLVFSATATFLLIHNIITRKDDYKGEFVPLYIFIMIAWFIFGNLYSSSIKNDSRGIPLK
ncbi:MAG TPA: DUF3137 domain-containing protein [Bacteroidales bacterium]|nr:DUF3137 domain-containing protein [Bacteroidales bacterium]